MAAEYEASEVKREDFCKQRDLGLKTLARYVTRYRKQQGGSKDPQRWVAVEVAGGNGSGGELCVLLSSGRRIEVKRGFDVTTLRQLVAVLEQGGSCFGVGPATRIYLAAGTTDMRKGFEGLYGLVRDRLSCDPLSGHVFLFCNAQRNRLKLLFWDGSGLWVCAKRLEKGRFGWPAAAGEETKVTLTQEELTLLVGGIDLTQTRRRAWHRVRGAA